MNEAPACDFHPTDVTVSGPDVAFTAPSYLLACPPLSSPHRLPLACSVPGQFVSEPLHLLFPLSGTATSQIPLSPHLLQVSAPPRRKLLCPFRSK